MSHRMWIRVVLRDRAGRDGRMRRIARRGGRRRAGPGGRLLGAGPGVRRAGAPRLRRSGPGVEVLPKFDVESTKTVGLTNPDHRRGGPAPVRPVLEQRDPQHAPAQGARACSPRSSRRTPASCPTTFKAKDGTWYGFAGPGPDPARQHQARPRGRPAHGASATCSTRSGRARSGSPSRSSARRRRTPPACSPPGATRRPAAFFRDLKANGVQVLSGNKQVATAVGSGQIAFGLTDTDDAMGEIDAGQPGRDRLPRPRARRARHAVHPQHAGDHQGRPAPRGGRGPGRPPAQPRGRGHAGRRPERPDPAAEDHPGLGPGRDAQDRPRDGRRLRGRGQGLGPGRRVPRRRVRRLIGGRPAGPDSLPGDESHAPPRRNTRPVVAVGDRGAPRRGSILAGGAGHRTWDFESDEPGRIARGFTDEVGTWEVVQDGKNRVLAQKASHRR